MRSIYFSFKDINYNNFQTLNMTLYFFLNKRFQSRSHNCENRRIAFHVCLTVKHSGWNNSSSTLGIFMKYDAVELHLSESWLSGSAWPFGLIFSYCNCIISIYGTNFPPGCQIHIRNYVLKFYFM